MEKGICKLCLEEKPLNKEHVPPRSTGNKSTRYKKGSFLEYMTSESPFDFEVKGKTYQGGISFYSFCERCNNFLGNEYVPYYQNWFGVGISLLQDNEAKGLNFKALKQYPLRTLKQILSMFVAVNPSPLGTQNHELIRYLSNPESRELPNNLRVFCYLNQGPKLRYLKLAATGNFRNASVVLCSEISFPPYGYVLILNNPNFKNDLLTEITEFNNHEPEKEYTLNFQMNKLETNLPIPMDYRSRQEIEKEILKNK